MTQTLYFIAPIIVALCAHCGPVPQADAQGPQPSLNWRAQAGNDVVYSSNSNVNLLLWLERPLGTQALNGNVTITTSRGGDSVTPPEAVLTDGSDLSVLLRVGVSGKAVVTAKTAELVQTFEVDVASADATKSTLSFEPNTVVAGEQSAQATVWAQDATGRNIVGAAAHIMSSDTTTTFLPTAITTGASGKGVFSVLPTRAGSQTITIAGENLNFVGTLNVAPAGIDSVKSTVTLSPPTTPADGTTPMTITVQVTDAFGNPIAQRPITLTSSIPASTVSLPQGHTDPSGAFQATVKSASRGLITVTARVYPEASSPVILTAQGAFVSGS